MWRAVGLLTAGGALRAAVLMLRNAALSDCAAAYVAACQEAGIRLTGPPDCGGVVNLFYHSGNTPDRRPDARPGVNAVDLEFEQYVVAPPCSLYPSLICWKPVLLRSLKVDLIL